MQLPNPFSLAPMRSEQELQAAEPERAASYRVVQRMIDTTKANLGDNSFDFLLWGWLVLVAALGHYALLWGHTAQPWLPWAVLMPLGGVVAAVHNFRRERRTTVPTYLDDLLGYLWLGFTVLLVALLALMLTGRISFQSGFILFMTLYGLGTFASGGALRFRPLVYGGLGAWAFALLGWWASYSQLLLLIAATVTVSYIVPGYLLRRGHRRGAS
ncbi:hypothetical protein F0P96_20125 [Hymenobacter busanensis]|uniref:Uncharacterized protein n=1 Tax=Hymenobacter busanensis TaxID=2607656 RepID=A0A7L4ZXZ0_9BACT|nr:hypothetical protein [Hymenobacter busanensis]KAA9325312.1 hypothetical protein F0P96_20125 [Hymenobacter busanensis]QHJ07695.1 hypothetical protein GUY19_10515 [Hymenobacter busanensis]